MGWWCAKTVRRVMYVFLAHHHAIRDEEDDAERLLHHPLLHVEIPRRGEDHHAEKREELIAELHGASAGLKGRVG